MSDNESARRRRKLSRVLIAIFGVGAPLAGVGIAIWATTPAPGPDLQTPCYGDTCVACLGPSKAECVVLARCGGEPCSDPGGPDAGVDPYAGAAGRLARGLRQAVEKDAAMTFHTDIEMADGGVSDCWTQVFLDPDQRAAWRRTVQAGGVASDVVDCRFANMPAKGKRGQSRREVVAGMPTNNGPPDAGIERFPDDTVTSLDAGPDP